MQAGWLHRRWGGRQGQVSIGNTVQMSEDQQYISVRLTRKLLHSGGGKVPLDKVQGDEKEGSRISRGISE